MVAESERSKSFIFNTNYINDADIDVAVVSAVVAAATVASDDSLINDVITKWLQWAC